MMAVSIVSLLVLAVSGPYWTLAVGPNDTSASDLYTALKQIPPDQDAICAALDRAPELVNVPLVGQATALAYICQGPDRQSLRLAQRLCERHGADVNAGRGQLYPLCVAVQAQAPDLVGYLLGRSPDMDRVADALELAATYPNLAVFGAVLRHLVQHGGAGARTSSAFLAAASRCNLAQMQALLNDAGARPGVRDESGRTAAHLVVGHGMNRFYGPLHWLVQIMPGLLTAADAQGRTALGLLDQAGTCTPAFLNYLHKAIADADGGREATRAGAEAMLAALARAGLSAAEVRDLLAAYPTAAFSQLDDDGSTALMVVAGRLPAPTDIAAVLIRNGADVNEAARGTAPGRLRTALSEAVAADSPGMVAYLVGHCKVDLDQVVAGLGAAIRDGRRRAFRVLVDYLAADAPAVLDRADPATGQTAFQAAASRADTACLRALFRTGRVDGRQRDGLGNTIAHLAAASADDPTWALIWIRARLGAELFQARNDAERTAMDLISDRTLPWWSPWRWFCGARSS